MKRKSERRSAWATAPPCSRRSSSASPGVKKSRSSTAQELHRLEQQDDLYLDISGESPPHPHEARGFSSLPPPERLQLYP